MGSPLEKKIDSVTEGIRSETAAHRSEEAHYVITIARQFGSLGQQIAERLSDILGIEFYDIIIIEEASRRLNLPVSVISSREERRYEGLLSSGFPLGTASVAQQQEIFKTQSRIIRDIAARESCIIIGRCSDYVLQNAANAMHVYIYAPYGARYRNCVDILEMEPREARRKIEMMDKERKFYHKQFAGFLADDPNHKDLMLNSDFLGVEGTAETIARMAKAKFGDLVTLHEDKM